MGQDQPSNAANSAQAAEAAGSAEVLHILVGHSAIIRTEGRLKRVLIGNPVVLTTITSSPNEIIATAAAAGSSSLVLRYTNDESKIIEVFADVDVSMLRDAVARAFPGQDIHVEGEEARVLLSGTASNQAVSDQLAKMAAPFAKDVVNSVQLGRSTRAKQIMLKVKFAEVDRRKLEQYGFNLFSTGATNTIGAVGTQQFGGTSLGNGARLEGAIGAPTTGYTSNFALNDLLNIFIFRPDLNLGATIKALQDKNILQILAEPNLLAVSGEPAKFLAGGELPYPIVQAGVGGQNTVTIQFKPFGVKLDFTGTVEADDVVRLKVAPEVSAVDYANAINLQGTVLPAISTRRAETVVDLRNGQSFGIAGLLDQRTTAQLSKVPGIGDIPILGVLFRSKGVDRSNTELLVIVTPTIVDSPAVASVEPQLPKTPYQSVTPENFDKGVGDKKKENHQ
jgi:pilus assembly protein CpaC